MARDIFAVDPDDDKKKSPKDKAYPKQLPPRAPDQVLTAGDAGTWPPTAPNDNAPVDFEQASEQIQRLASRTIDANIAELQELSVAWRADITLAPTSFKAIEKLLALAGGTPVVRATPQTKKENALNELARSLIADEEKRAKT